MLLVAPENLIYPQISHFLLHSVHWETVFLSLHYSSTAFPIGDSSSAWNLTLTVNYTHSNLQQLTALWFTYTIEIHCTREGGKGLWCMQQVRRESKQLFLAFTALSPKFFIQKQLLPCLYGKVLTIHIVTPHHICFWQMENLILWQWHQTWGKSEIAVSPLEDENK